MRVGKQKPSGAQPEKKPLLFVVKNHPKGKITFDAAPLKDFFIGFSNSDIDGDILREEFNRMFFYLCHQAGVDADLTIAIKQQAARIFIANCWINFANNIYLGDLPLCRKAVG